MSDFDLSKLSAPLEALRPEIENAYKQLDNNWERIISQFNNLLIPCTIGYTYSEHQYSEQWCRLEWRKWKGNKRFCITFYSIGTDSEYGPEEVEDVTPFEEWSTEQRIDMIRHVPKLIVEAVDQIKKFLDTMRVKEVK